MNTSYYKIFIITIAVYVGMINMGVADTLTLSGTLAAMPCTNNGHLEISHDSTEITSGQSVTCVSVGGEIRIKNISIENGAIFSAKAIANSNGSTHNYSTQWADTSCSSGALLADCNVCANNVQQQFVDLFSDKAQISIENWRLSNKTKYEPSGKKPRKAFSWRLGTHIQGFVKVESGIYSGTYSHKDGKGLIFFIKPHSRESYLRLDGLHSAWSAHPSGMSSLGKFVIFQDKRDLGSETDIGRELRVMNSRTDFKKSNEKTLLVKNSSGVDKEVYKFTAGGGLGMVKLNSGGFLLIATHPGGPTKKNENRLKKTDFFYIEGALTSSKTGRVGFGQDIGPNGRLNMSSEHVGRWVQDKFYEDKKAKQEKYQYSENLTVIPECGSGDIYLIHTSSTKPWVKVKQPSVAGYWRLSKVIWTSAGPALDILSVHEEDQTLGKCFHRSAATAWVNANHEIELYCSEYRKSKIEKKLHFKTRAVGRKAQI